MRAVLEARDLAKAYGGVAAVDGVTLAVAAGEVVALIGPNGAGKTTTFNMINGQIAPDGGTVLIDGRDVTRHGPATLWRAGVARTFQIPAVFASMTAVENVGVALMPRRGLALVGGLGPAMPAVEGEAHRLLADIGLAAAAGVPAGTLAYGDIKRLEVAMALASRPRLLLMDEPTAGMAAADRRGLMSQVKTLARRRGVAVLFTEHDMDVVFGHADRILVLHRGKLLAEGEASAIRSNPAVREVYLGAGPSGN